MGNSFRKYRDSASARAESPRGRAARSAHDPLDPVHDYQLDQRLRGLRSSTIERADRAIRSLAHHAGCKPQEVSPTMVRAWLDSSPSSGGASVQLRSVRPYFRWLVAEGIISTDPTAGVQVKVVEKPQLTASHDDIASMLASAKGDKRATAILTLLADTGARRSEVGDMELGDLRVHLDQGLVVIRNSKSQPRIVPLTARALKAVRGYLRLVVDKPDSAPAWGVAVGEKLVSRLVAEHTGGELAPHALRRAFVVAWLRKGGSLPALGQLMGWSSSTLVAMSARYSKALAGELAAEEFARIMGEAA